MNTAQEHHFANVTEQAQAQGRMVATQLAQAVLSKGSAVLAVSGGRSPIAFFQALAQADLPWKNITVTLVDERIIETDHVDSNASLVREHLLQNRAVAATFQGLLADDFIADNFVDVPALVQQANQHFLAPDVVVLGMGEDGHTASLFPLVADLSASDKVIAVQPETAPYKRLSLSLQAIIQAPTVVLAIGGAAKIAVYHQAALKATADLPISFVLHYNPRQTQVFIHE